MSENAFSPAGSHVTIQFGNRKAAEHFLSWLCEMGEQDYWEWMKVREHEEPEGDITAVGFDYHNTGPGIVTATCGRLDRDE